MKTADRTCVALVFHLILMTFIDVLFLLRAR